MAMMASRFPPWIRAVRRAAHSPRAPLPAWRRASPGAGRRPSPRWRETGCGPTGHHVVPAPEASSASLPCATQVICGITRSWKDWARSGSTGRSRISPGGYRVHCELQQRKQLPALAQQSLARRRRTCSAAGRRARRSPPVTRRQQRWRCARAARGSQATSPMCMGSWAPRPSRGREDGLGGTSRRTAPQDSPDTQRASRGHEPPVCAP